MDAESQQKQNLMEKLKNKEDEYETAALIVSAMLLLGGYAPVSRGGPAPELTRGDVAGQKHGKLYGKSQLSAVGFIVNFPPEILKG